MPNLKVIESFSILSVVFVLNHNFVHPYSSVRFDMKRDVCNTLIIVVCDFFGAVKGFRAETVFVCMRVSILPVCLRPISSHIAATLHQLISYFRVCDVCVKLLYHEVKCCCLNSCN